MRISIGEEARGYKFENLEVWQLALEYTNMIYALSESLPRFEEYNLKSQITRAATSIALNIAEGSTGQSDPEQARFLGMAIRSLIETVCLSTSHSPAGLFARSYPFARSLSLQPHVVLQTPGIQEIAGWRACCSR